MAARELFRNFATRYCSFYIDSYDDTKNLPTSNQSGKAEMSLSTPCSFGSVAKDSKGQKYVLTGSNKWVLYSSSSNSGSDSGSSETQPDVEWGEIGMPSSGEYFEWEEIG